MMNILLVCDDVWHPAEIIERGLKTMDSPDMAFDIVKTAKDILTPAFVRKYDALVNASGCAINAANSAPWFEPGVTEFGPEEFREYVVEGGGFVVVHAGLTIGGLSSPAPAYTEVVGSYFLSHPPRETTHVAITARNEITRGARDFSERDEHYQLAFTATDIEPFLQTTSTRGGTTVSGYLRHVGRGRVAVLAPGHTLAVWENPSFRTLFLNAVRWAAGERTGA